MLLQPSDDQAFFHETTARFLKDQVPVAKLRALRDDADGFDPAYWKAGAELGWTSLLVDEQHGGGSISGHGLTDLSLIAYEFGRQAAPGPLLPTNLVAGALSAAGTHLDLLGDLLAGATVASWALGEGPVATGPADIALEVRVDGDELVLDGLKRPVESAVQASHVLVTGRTGDGLTQVLVPLDTAGVTVEPLTGVDLTRRFAAVRFSGARVPAGAAVGIVGGADAAVARQHLTALALNACEAVGAMQTGFDMTVEWGFDRYSFGRPIASYQALKHRYADMKSWLEAGHAVTDEAVAALATDAPDAAMAVLAAAAFVGDRSTELLHDCVQLHGGIGVTFEHDLHLYLRRGTIARSILGTPDQHRRRLAALVALQEDPS